MRRDLADPELFGNEAGEDEAPEILDSYFVDKAEFVRFFSEGQRLCFVRSRKGVGKSALLRETLFRRQKADIGELLIYLKASDLIATQEIKSESPSELIYGWQQRICSRINMELGSVLKVAFSDDKMVLVEGAELAGFRSRNLIGSLLDRLKIKGIKIGDFGVEVSRERPSPGNSQALLSRILKKDAVTVWLFVDDIDATFLNTPLERLKASTFFSACRNLVGAVDGLQIRASVRSDVWSILAQYDESLDKCEQYIVDLLWSTAETGHILESKILSFFRRYYPDNATFRKLRIDRDRQSIYQLVFRDPFPWGRRAVEAFRPIHIFSAGRPRWAAQLCKLAGVEAFDTRSEKITFGHIRTKLRKYGEARLSDLYKEHRHQCSNMESLIEAFGNGPTIYTTEQLLERITDRIIKLVGVPLIDGVRAENGSLSIASFLYRIGFIAARDDEAVDTLGFVRFEDRPNLLTTVSNLDDGHRWEVHPSYREALRIRPGRTYEKLW